MYEANPRIRITFQWPTFTDLGISYLLEVAVIL